MLKSSFLAILALYFMILSCGQKSTNVIQGNNSIDLNSIDHITIPGDYAVSGSCSTSLSVNYIKVTCGNVVNYTTCDNNSFSIPTVTFETLPTICVAQIGAGDPPNPSETTASDNTAYIPTTGGDDLAYDSEPTSSFLKFSYYYSC